MQRSSSGYTVSTYHRPRSFCLMLQLVTPIPRNRISIPIAASADLSISSADASPAAGAGPWAAPPSACMPTLGTFAAGGGGALLDAALERGTASAIAWAAAGPSGKPCVWASAI